VRHPLSSRYARLRPHYRLLYFPNSRTSCNIAMIPASSVRAPRGGGSAYYGNVYSILIINDRTTGTGPYARVIRGRERDPRCARAGERTRGIIRICDSDAALHNHFHESASLRCIAAYRWVNDERRDVVVLLMYRNLRREAPRRGQACPIGFFVGRSRRSLPAARWHNATRRNSPRALLIVHVDKSIYYRG